MAATLEQLEDRVTNLERETAQRGPEHEIVAKAESPAERGARVAREGKASQTRISKAWDELMVKWGIHVVPIAMEALQEQLRAAGIKEEDNEFSRAIIAAREE